MSDDETPREDQQPQGDRHQGDDKRQDDKKRDEDGRGKDGKEEKKPSPLANPRVRIGLIIAAVAVVAALIAWGVYYWTTGQYEQETNDAYLQADMVTVAPKVGGYVEQVLIEDNQLVEPGQPLVKIDERETKARHDQAVAQVAQGKAAIVEYQAQIRRQETEIVRAQAQLAGARSTALYAQRQVDRYTPLAASGAQTAEQLDQMRQTRDQARAEAVADEAQVESARRQIDVLNAQIQSAQAQVEQAQAQVDQADVDLRSTLVRSSIRGRVGDRSVRVGQYVQTGTRLMSIVPLEGVYLVANYKETQIGLMRIGQPATFTVDAVSGGEFHGTVDSFAPGTGAQFALLPPQNATGNFTKIVQRVPVRIRIEAGPEARKVLVPGLSVIVTVDTIGAKEEQRRIKEEAKRTEERRQREHDDAVQRNREAEETNQPQNGAGK
ncbi:HlyD family secretion protein [Nitrospirillum sp. BR 11163]|uniref:HlyD family secretion protein n=1 Tax=Nitrospirillum sp. BR 11163 TaxID=3104323 RepID=UPI002AFFE6EF|nr:HlyD family secretion protein [Nitrospirillum sp. BR 11163]MEA1672924.1 HlyD family secretion protein [Nitrospirillum sp. BR 11163]